MDITSTPFLTCAEIVTGNTDLYSDAWGFESEFSDVISELDHTEFSPSDALISRIMTAAFAEI